MKYSSLLFLPIILFAQINYSGSVSPTYFIRISDGSEITLPFRLADLQLGYSYGNFEFKINTALEARWKGSKAELDIREAYLTWYPSFGEVKLGKIIHTWGAADGNNPTDNINPYDFYYMFLAGVDRKIGILSGSVKAYWQNLNAEVIVTPEHIPNRIPFGETDFPIEFPDEPNSYSEIENPFEYGVRLQSSFNWGDVSVSYFNGYDKNSSLFTVQNVGIRNPSEPYKMFFGYRETDVIGTDIVIFISDFTIRSELGYFITRHQDDDYYLLHVSFPLNMEAEYLQYVIQLEYSGFSEVNIGAQYLGTYINKVDGETFSPQGKIPLTKANFIPGMGTPFAIIAEKALIVNSSINLLDDRLSVEAMSLINLEETGYIIGINVDFSPIENWKLKLGINKFIGDADDPDNRFTQMEDFSHLSLGLEFNF